MSKNSDGWPELHPPLKRRLHLQISNLLLEFGNFLSRRNSKWFKRLQHEAEHEPYAPDSCPPEGADIELERFLYGDLYPVEDFDELKFGMDQLFRAHESTFPTYRSERWHEWVEQRKDEVGGVATSSVGYLDLSDACTFLKDCHVTAFGIEGYVFLGLNFTPSEECRDEFEDLVTERSETTSILTLPNLFKPIFNLSLFSWVRYSLGFRRESESAVLRREIDRFFLRCNREVADLLGSHIGSGLSPESPLPSLEIISTDIPRNQLLSYREEKRKENSSEQSLRHQFWTSIGHRPPLINPWRWEWGQLYRTRRSDEYKSRGYQMVVHRPDLVELEDYRIDDREPGEEATHFGLALRAYLTDRTGRFGALLAIQEQFLRFRDRLVNLRNLLSPQLRNRSGIGLLLKVVRKGTEVLSDLNAVRFSQKRLWSQVEKRRVRGWLFGSLHGAKRSKRDSKETVDFVDDWSDEIETLRNENQSRLERIESAYDKLFSIVNARVTFLLQITVVGLTFLLLWLTFLMVLSRSSPRQQKGDQRRQDPVSQTPESQSLPLRKTAHPSGISRDSTGMDSPAPISSSSNAEWERLSR